MLLKYLYIIYTYIERTPVVDSYMTGYCRYIVVYYNIVQDRFRVYKKIVQVQVFVRVVPEVFM